MDHSLPHPLYFLKKNMLQVWTNVILEEANILNIYYFSDVFTCINNPKAQNLDFSKHLNT